MELESLPHSSRLSDRITHVIKEGMGQPVTTDELASAISDVDRPTLRRALNRLADRGLVTRIARGVWGPPLPSARAVQPYPRSEVVMPRSTSEDLVRWAEGVAALPPIELDSLLFPADSKVTVVVEPRFMGVELVFTGMRGPVFGLVLFSEIPTEAERLAMIQGMKDAGRI